MSGFITMEQIDTISELVKSKTAHKPKVGMILGSGLGGLAEEIDQPDLIHYSELPDWPVSTVEGHVGRLVLGELEGQNVMVMQGRAHYYEGYDMPLIGLPIRVMARIGIEILIITNAAGAVHPEFEPGDLMLIVDHINLVGMAGLNPLRGPNLSEFGPRFPDMSQVYDRELLKIAKKVAKENNIKVRQGVYVCLAGPSFETPADLRFLKTIGVDAVGMSTVPEAIVARHGGLRVLGISGISNKANLDGDTLTTHEEVLEAGRILVPKLTAVVKGVLQGL